MRTRHGLPARIAPAAGSLLVSWILIAGCGELTEPEPFVGETSSLAWCASDASCSEEEAAEEVAATATDEEAQTETTDEPRDWLVRCTSDAECAIGQCVCRFCTESCSADDANACSGAPAGAACFAGGTTARAALCHASTVPGICLPPCEAGDDCGEGHICALGACLPEPPKN
jgi:hypothetical protein